MMMAMMMMMMTLQGDPTGPYWECNLQGVPKRVMHGDLNGMLQRNAGEPKGVLGDARGSQGAQ